MSYAGNNSNLVGRATKDVEVVETATGTKTARMTLAVDRPYKKDADVTADFIPCVAFGKTAEFLGKYGKKGTKFVVDGHLKSGSYTNKDNQKVYTLDVVIDQLTFAESKANSSNGNSNSNSNPAPSNNDEGFMNIPDGIEEELPFN